MENLNFAPFWVGQKVAYITVGGLLPYGKECVISEVHRLGCGCWAVRVLEYDNGYNASGNYTCITCRKQYLVPNTEKRYFRHSSFRPLQQTKFPLMTFEKIKESSPEILIPN